MSKRFATIFFISVATIIILLVVFFLILFLAPGVSIFGLRYIGTGLHTCKTGKINLYQEYGGNYQGIEITAYEVPVNIKFTEERYYQVEYFDEYAGLTTTKIDDPSMKTSFTGGIVHINISEFHKFLWQTSTSDRYINLYVPLAYVSDGINNSSINLEIKSTKSPVTFSKDETTDERVPAFKSIKIKTNGKVNYNTKVTAELYQLDTSHSISINKDKSNIVEAKGYNLKSTSGKIKIESDVENDITAETKNGSISLISCKNLIAKTEYGSIKYAGEGDGKVQIRGVVNIETKSGNITLGNVEGVGENKIVTKSGSIYIEKIVDGSATSQRGKVEIKSVQNFKIETNVGKVYVQESLSSVEVTTKRGDVHLGGDKMNMANPKVFSRIGRVYVTSASGNVDIETVSSNVEFKNTSSQNIKINCGAKLKAEGLTGTVDIYSEKDFSIKFSKISANSTVRFGGSCKKAEITALENTLDDTGFTVMGKKVVLQQFVDNTYIYPNGQEANTPTVDNSLNKQFSYYLDVKPADATKNNAEINLIVGV